MTAEPPCDPADNVTRSLLGYGAIAGPLYLLSGLIQGLTREGFDLTRHALSLLSNGRYGWIQMATFGLTGAMTIAAAAGPAGGDDDARPPALRRCRDWFLRYYCGMPGFRATVPAESSPGFGGLFSHGRPVVPGRVCGTGFRVEERDRAPRVLDRPHGRLGLAGGDLDVLLPGDQKPVRPPNDLTGSAITA